MYLCINYEHKSDKIIFSNAKEFTEGGVFQDIPEQPTFEDMGISLDNLCESINIAIQKMDQHGDICESCVITPQKINTNSFLVSLLFFVSIGKDKRKARIQFSLFNMITQERSLLNDVVQHHLRRNTKRIKREQ